MSSETPSETPSSDWTDTDGRAGKAAGAGDVAGDVSGVGDAVRRELTRRGVEAACDVVVHAGAPAVPTVDVVVSLAQVWKRIAGVMERARGVPVDGGAVSRQSVRTGWVRQYGRAGAAGWVLAAVVASVLAVVVVRGGRGMWHSQSSAASIMYATRSGERADITLPDGSMVTLNVASRLDVPTNFGSGNRTLVLRSGEAMFNVVHTAGAPFIVRVGGTSARVLGTTFLVRHYGTDSATTVAVQSGKVAVHGAVVTAQRVAVVDPRGGVQMMPVTGAPFSFASGVLTLDRVAVRDAILELDRWYNADIRVTDPVLRSRQLSGAFTAGSLTDLTAMLSFTLHARVAREGRVVKLYPQA